jgi:hypothetical protein
MCVRKGRLKEPACLLVIYGFRCKWDGFAMYEELLVYKRRACSDASRVLLLYVGWLLGRAVQIIKLSTNKSPGNRR